MNKRKKKKMRKKIYQRLIDDVALEISQNSYWRKTLFSSSLEVKLEVSYRSLSNIPIYIQDIFSIHKLEFLVSKVSSSPSEHFDEGLIIFKFESKEYPKITRFSGNNPNIV